MAVSPTPEGYPNVSAYLAVDGASDAIEFYKSVLGATETVRMEGPPGKIGHAEIKIGDSLVMLADADPDIGFPSPKKLGGSAVHLSVYVEDVDKTFAAAIESGATETRPCEDQFYGDRRGQFEDPWGHHWSVATHIEDVTDEQMQERMAAMES